MNNVVTSQWAIWILPLLAVCVWIAYEARSHVAFHGFMASNDYPLLRKRISYSINGTLNAIRSSRFIGTAWFIRRLHGFVFLIAIIILTFSLLRAAYIGHSLEFSRSGALVVIAGLISILIGFLDSRKTRQVWEQLVARVQDAENKETLQTSMVSPIEHAQFVAAKVSVAVSIVGTIVWAYGDLFLACGLFPLVKIVDISSVVCM